MLVHKRFIEPWGFGSPISCRMLVLNTSNQLPSPQKTPLIHPMLVGLPLGDGRRERASIIVTLGGRLVGSQPLFKYVPCANVYQIIL